jgi:NADH:flavin oxidoreductase / NADH oxidase family
MLKPVQSWEFRTNRGHGSLPPTKPGDTFLFDLSENPQIQLHSAFDMVRNGYLADTFLQDGTNKRTDRYGGSVEGRARLSLELVEALLSAFGPGRVGVRVSPSGQWGSISDSNPDLTFGYFAEQLPRRNLPNAALKAPTPTRSRGARALHPKPFTDGLRTKRLCFLSSIPNGFESSLSGRMRS